MSISVRAKEAHSWFETAKREGSEPESYFVRVKDGAPEWVKELVYAGHQGFSDFLPDDWRYAKIADALEWIADADDADESQAEFADDAVDVYTHDRFAWLSSNPNRSVYCDAALVEYGYASGSEPLGVVDIIGWGQYAEASEVYALVLRALDDLAE